MKILIDIDSTLNNFDEHFILTLKKLGFGFDRLKYNSWDVSKFIIGPKSKKEKENIFKAILDELEFWRGLEPLPYSQFVLKQLSKEHIIEIVSTPWKFEDDYQQVKIDWVLKYYPFIREEQIIFSDRKWELDGDILIDDKNTTLEKAYGIMLTICPEQAYNKNVVCDYRFNCWDQIPDIISDIGKLGY